MKNNKKLSLVIAMSLITISAANATVWTRNIQGGTIKFDDWGYTGPGGRNATQFGAINGFGGPAEGNTLDVNGGIGQIQHVVTLNPDGLTPDAPYSFLEEYTNAPLYPDANSDGQVNFYNWGYTTVAGSTFNKMQIDYDGDYLVKRYDMTFKRYDRIFYKNEGVNPTAVADGTYSTIIGFQPYALSDATGWCGSVLASNPAALEEMAGQVKFDFGFEVYFPGGDFTPGTGYMQIISDFEMRSYGTVELEVTLANGGTSNVIYRSDAVVNNTSPAAGTVNPITGLKEVGGAGVDENYYNKVSFMGAGIIPAGIWVLVPVDDVIEVRTGGILAIRNDQILTTQDGLESDGTPVVPVDPETGLALGRWMYHTNSFANFTFLLRADGIRVINAVDFNVYTDLSNVPANAFNVSGEIINLDGNVIRDLSVTDVNPVDPDGDGLEDWNDNCRDVYNPGQQDTDGDNYGNACDGDFNNDNTVNSLDLGLFKQMFLTTGDVQADMNGDQIVNSLDIGLFKARFLQPVGPSGTVPFAQ